MQQLTSQRRRETFDPLYLRLIRARLLCACRACFRPAETLGSQVHASAWRGGLVWRWLGLTLGIVRSWVWWWRCCIFLHFLSFVRRQLFISSGGYRNRSCNSTILLIILNESRRPRDGDNGLASFFLARVFTTRLTLRCELSRGLRPISVCRLSKVQTIRDHELNRYQIIDPFVWLESQQCSRHSGTMWNAIELIVSLLMCCDC